MRVLLVLPTYQEAANIERVLRAAKAEVPGLSILVVDDSSPDGTAAIARRVSEELPGIYVLERPGKEGLGRAYIAGFEWGLERGFEGFIEMDSDFSHDPAQLPQFIERLEEGYDVVVGSRYVPGGRVENWSMLRKVISVGGNAYARLALRLPIHDSTSGFRAYSARVLRRIPLEEVRSSGYGFQVEMTLRTILAGGRHCEVPIVFRDRELGASKMSSRIVLEAFLLVTRWGLAMRGLGRAQFRLRDAARDAAHEQGRH
jgi:dolichol-phosphate mannosyltransferase